jgi:predicted nucleic acid-binding protein
VVSRYRERPLILLSDANVLLDLAPVGGLECLLELGTVEVLDVVLSEVERDPNIPDLSALGFVSVAVQTSWLDAARAMSPQGLSFQDALCLYHAKQAGRLLLSNDKLLRNTATNLQVKVHGTLWVVQELERHKICQAALLCSWLEQWTTSLHAFLPRRELEQIRLAFGCG